MLKEESSVGLKLFQPLRGRHGLPTNIDLTRHATKWEEAASRLRQQSWLPLDGDLRLDAVLLAYESFRTVKSGNSDYPVFLWEDAIALLVWCARSNDAESYLARCAAEMGQWKESVLDQLGGLETWRRAQSEVIAGGRTRLEAILQEEEKRHKAADLPRVELIG